MSDLRELVRPIREAARELARINRSPTWLTSVLQETANLAYSRSNTAVSRIDQLKRELRRMAYAYFDREEAKKAIEILDRAPRPMGKKRASYARAPIVAKRQRHPLDKTRRGFDDIIQSDERTVSHSTSRKDYRKSEREYGRWHDREDGHWTDLPGHRSGRMNPPDPDLPEEPVRFYPAVSNFTMFQDHPDAMIAQANRISEASARRLVQEHPEFVPDDYAEFYTPLSQTRNAIEAAAAATEFAWHDALQPEYKAWPAAVAALSATKIEIGCEHLRLPFPAIAIRLPHGFVQEPGKPVIHSVFATVLRNMDHGSIATTSWDAPATPRSRPLAMRWKNLGKETPAIFSVMLKWSENNLKSLEDDSFFIISIALVPRKTIDEQLQKVEVQQSRVLVRGTNYVPSLQLIREMISLAVGTAFLATGKLKKEASIVAVEKRPRPERRRFEKEHGKTQPTYTVGRDLILPREQGVPSPKEAGEEGPGEGEGRQLRFSHLRAGHLRFQPHGPRSAPQYDLIFVAPMIVRADLPLGPTGKVSPSSIKDVGDVRDIERHDDR